MSDLIRVRWLLDVMHRKAGDLESLPAAQAEAWMRAGLCQPASAPWPPVEAASPAPGAGEADSAAAEPAAGG